MKLVLCGTPNVGKTTLFNALTGQNRKTGNYHGVTVDIAEAKSKYADFTVFDLPGIYGLDGYSMEEKTAIDFLEKQDKSDTVLVQVVSSLHFQRSVSLYNALCKLGFKMVLAFTMSDKLTKKGGAIDFENLERDLLVRCVPVNALRNKDVKLFLKTMSLSEPPYRPIEDLSKYYVFPKEKEQRLLNPVVALSLFFLFTVLGLYFAFGKNMPGERMKGWIETGFSLLCEWIVNNSDSLFIKTVVVDGVLTGVGSVLAFLPQIAWMYLIAILLEESGFMSLLSISSDGLLSLISLSGRSVFFILLGYGCSAGGILSTRALENKNLQKRAVSCLYFLPCSARLPVYLILLSQITDRLFVAVLLLYLLGTAFGIFASALFKGKEEDFTMELAEISLPNPFYVLKKLLFELKEFIIKVLTYVFVFTFAVSLLSKVSFHGFCDVEQSILKWLCGGLKYLFYPIGVRDWKVAFSVLGGFVAKENIVGFLSSFYPSGLPFSSESITAVLTFVCLMPPCVSAICTAGSELTKKTAWGLALLQSGIALAVSYLVYFVLISRLFGIFVLGTILGISAVLLFWRTGKNGKTYGKRKYDP